MNVRTTLIIILAVVIIGLLALRIYRQTLPPEIIVTSFEECAAAKIFPIMEGYPRQCTDSNGVVYTEDIPQLDIPEEIVPTLTQTDARALAESSDVCTKEGAIGLFETYNAVTGTWWFALDAVMNGCSPACVVYDTTAEVEVNWRCTGLLP